jgi:hypothetical protein
MSLLVSEKLAVFASLASRISFWNPRNCFGGVDGVDEGRPMYN